MFSRAGVGQSSTEFYAEWEQLYEYMQAILIDCLHNQHFSRIYDSLLFIILGWCIH